MRSLEMSGSFPLNDDAIDETLMRIAPGNYALGYMDGDTFIVFYVGRSDGDLRQRLHEWVGMPSRYERHASAAKASWRVARVESAESSYTHFAYSYARSADEAYAKEWRNYDAFGGGYGLDNECEPISAVHSRTALSANAAAAPVA
jgi:hypothetical protein